MATASEILMFAAKIALDKLSGSPERTDEAVGLFKNWAAQRSAEAVNSEFAEARRGASDQATLRGAVESAAAERGQSLNAKEREKLELTIASGLSSVPAQVENGEAAVDRLVEQLFPGKSRSYVIWTDTPEIVGTGEQGRYVHFSYDGNSYRVRDYIGGQISYPAGPRVTDKQWEVVELTMSASQVWNASGSQIRCTKEYGLYVSVEEREEWGRMLMLLTEVARQFQQR